MSMIKLFLFSVSAAFVLWFITFVSKPFNFWAMMSFNACALIALAWASREKILFKNDLTVQNVLKGTASAVILYAIFLAGRKIIAFIPGDKEMLLSVYQNGSETPRWLVAALLFFPIGFAEEYFWRGFIQQTLYRNYTKFQAVIFSSLIYTAVHISTINPVLILASFSCGLYWGLIYAWTGSFWAVAFSHMIWDPLIFVFFQIL